MGREGEREVVVMILLTVAK
uniref:Uncharacterized protein MANES_05G103900 n=1 Tax=Rhizophora mucronata TaxID=61149 RepID=A0A2P2IYJ3_RHIMU